VDEGKVVLTQVDYVPANTGVILYYGTAGDYDIPAISAAGAVSDNELIGVTSRTLVEWTTGGDGKYNYILQGGEFKKASNGYLKAYRAYLHTSYNVAAPGARELEIVFDEEEATGITDVRSMNADVNGSAYDMQGRKVEQPQKGLYIMNGKKVVVK
jgi:hypothetical protein